MRSQNDDQLSPIQLTDTKQEYPKKAKIMYTREQLLSLSELDICSKLPSRFDTSILSEFEDASNSIPERPRIPGSLSSQNIRRGEYGSSPPTRGDSSSYSRGVHGRWDSRSSGSNDKDSDSQLDLESDSGRRYGNQSRRSWQNSEHDGLLGSGSFPKPSGYTTASVTKVRDSSQYQLNKTNEPYHPPRPYKPPSHSRRDATDEETFGSSESSSQDRAEEERKRRASFEQFRKEAKATQEKQTQYPDKRKENVDPDIAALLANSADDKKLWDKNIRMEDIAPIISQGDSVKCPAQTSASRPLVPPGFTGVPLEKNLGTKSFISHSTAEAENCGVVANSSQIEGNDLENGTSNNLVDEKSVSDVDVGQKRCQIKTIRTSFTDTIEKAVILSLDEAVSENSVGVLGPSHVNSNLSEVYGGQKNNEGTYYYAKKVHGQDTVGIASQENSTSILANLFSKASIADSGVSSFSEPGDVNADTGSPVPFQSSKFTRWFLEEEKRSDDELSCGKPEDLLSLIVNREKDGRQVDRASNKILPFGSNDVIPKSVATIATIEPPYQSSTSVVSQGVLTCEDLEQSILSECSDNSSNLDQSFQAWSVLDAKAEKRPPEVDNHASQHLLSLLHKGTSAKEFPQSTIHESSENEAVPVNSVDNPSVGDAEMVLRKSENNLTLETLFGTAFMKELQSVKAPVSVQRGSVGGATQSDFPFPPPDDGFSPPTANKSTLEGDAYISNHIQRNKNEEAWLNFDASQSKMEAKDIPDEALEIELPDEESLITLCDPMPVGNASMPVDIVDKLAALNAVLKKERSSTPGFNDSSPFLAYQNPHERPTSQLAHLQRMNHGRQLFQPSDSHHELPASQHHFPANMIHHQASSFQHAAPNGLTRFSPPAHHPMLQQMHMQGNMLPPHLLRGLPRGAQMPPPYAINHIPGYAPDLPFPHHQPNYGGLELPMQVHGAASGGNSHPEALEKLIEMERRANLKHMHSVAGSAHGHGIGMDFRYR